MEKEKQRDKLIEIIVNAKQAEPDTRRFTEFLADFLLGYGVFVPDDGYDIDRLQELVEADKDGRCVVLPFLPPKVMWSCSKRQPKPAKSFYASEIGVLADMKAGCVFGEMPEEAESALANKENHVKN